MTEDDTPSLDQPPPPDAPVSGNSVGLDLPSVDLSPSDPDSTGAPVPPARPEPSNSAGASELASETSRGGAKLTSGGENGSYAAMRRSFNRTLDRLHTLRMCRRGAAAEAEALMGAVLAQARAAGAPLDAEEDEDLLEALRGLAREQADWALTASVLSRPDRAFESRHRATLDRAITRVDTLREWAREVLQTDAERAIRRKRALAIAGALGASAAAIAIVVLLTSGPVAPIETATITKPGGITGEYFKGKNFEKSVGTRADRRISFKGRRAWFPKAGADNYSVRWAGYLKFPNAGEHELCVRGDDGIRLFFNGQSHVDDWGDHGARTKCNTVNVFEETWYPVTVEYYESGKWAEAALLTGSTPFDVKPVAPDNLCCKE